jgi:ATP-dependent DNA helicase RecQ
MMDVLRGKATEKVKQYGHDKTSTFGKGSAFSEAQLRGVMRQLIAIGALAVDAQAFNTLQLTPDSRPVLRGERQVLLRESVATPVGKGRRSGAHRPVASALVANLAPEAQARFEALRAWRAEVAQSHNLPAFMIFQDATLAAVAALGPASLDALAGVSGIGAKKLQAYGEEVLRVVAGAGLGHNLRP